MEIREFAEGMCTFTFTWFSESQSLPQNAFSQSKGQCNSFQKNPQRKTCFPEGKKPSEVTLFRAIAFLYVLEPSVLLCCTIEAPAFRQRNWPATDGHFCFNTSLLNEFGMIPMK